MTMTDYKSLTLGELKTLLGEMGQPAFRSLTRGILTDFSSQL